MHGSFSAGERYVFELYNALGMMLGERLDGEPDPKQAAVAMAAMLTGSLVIATVFGNVAARASPLPPHRAPPRPGAARRRGAAGFRPMRRLPPDAALLDRCPLLPSVPVRVCVQV